MFHTESGTHGIGRELQFDTLELIDKIGDRTNEAVLVLGHASPSSDQL